jgi:hypothetical protein
MSKTTAKADHVAQLARMRRLCLELDDVRAESERLYTAITAEARHASDAAVERELAHEGLTQMPEPASARRLSARMPRAIAN